MIPAMILIPLKDNDEAEFPEALVAALHRQLFSVASGLTIDREIEGMWRDSEGRVYRERNDRYLVALQRWDDVAEFMAIVHWARREFRQLAVYIDIAGIPEVVED